jgi:leucyl aminopeptidase
VPEDAPLLGIPVFSDLTTPDGAGAEIDRDYLAQRRFEGKPGQAQALLADDGTTIVALGVGDKSAVDADALRRAGAALARNAGTATRVATTLVSAAPVPEWAAAVVEGIGLGAYRYERAPKRGESNGRVEHVTVVGGRVAPVARGQATVEATWMARNWINRPPRQLTPIEFATLAAHAAAEVGVTADIWDEKRITSEGLGGLLGVAAGAAEPPRLIRLEYRPARGRTKIALVGKGITFDSGGLSLKTAAGMMTMKDDMGGAAAVICATLAVAELRVPVGVTAWVAATENMPSGTAIHPGDVLVARNGKSIEVLNTDAEGRLVLADALSLAAEEEPEAIVDVATLTGGQRIALGDRVAAVMGTDEELIRRVIAAGAAAGEPAWELPLYAPYRKQLDSDVADIKNVSSGNAASSIMAGLFLKEFAGNGPWAHLDIAGPGWAESDDGWIAKGGTGWGTRTLIELVRTWRR